MSSPRAHLAKIAAAIIDTHINIRKSEWKLIDESGSVHLPGAGTTAYEKLHTWLKYQNELKSVQEKSVQDWIQIAYDLYALQHEQESADYRRTRTLLSWLHLMNNELLTPMTAEALRNLIVEAVKDDPNYRYVHSELIKKKSTLENAITIEQQSSNKEALEKKRDELKSVSEKLYALTDNRQYFRHFFEEIIKKKDDRGLDEKTYEDFLANVISERRKFEVTDAVFKALEIEKQCKVTIKQPVQTQVVAPVEEVVLKAEASANKPASVAVKQAMPVSEPVAVKRKETVKAVTSDKDDSQKDWPALTDVSSTSFFIPVNSKSSAKQPGSSKSSGVSTRAKSRKQEESDYNWDDFKSDTGVHNRRTSGRRY